ncbi:class I SAM-dependent methyltransferase [Sunxiuqinia elliptica]
MNILNNGDFWELFTKAKEKGGAFFFKKISFNSKKRTQSTFSSQKRQGANWWIIPEVKERENRKISGDAYKTFDKHLIECHLKNKRDLQLLSVACGSGNREITLSKSGFFKHVTGIDLSPDLIQEAQQKVHKMQLTNVSFEQADFYDFKMENNFYDVILFHSALHHFQKIEEIALRVKTSLKRDGILVLNEFVGKNRLQFTKHELFQMNKLLTTIPKPYRKRYLTKITKQKIYAPGVLRMIVSDPSEAVESETILPVIHKHFKVIEEKKIGGDLLMMVLKDIAHHFVNSNNQESKQILQDLFEKEDEYLQTTHHPNFIFGIYKK